MERNLRTIIVEDSEEDAELVALELCRGGFGIDYVRLDTAENFVQSLNSGEWDLILADYSMPHFSGLEALELVERHRPEVPLILISGSMGEDIAVEAMKSGAQDYLRKDNLKRLVPAVDRTLREAQTRKAHRHAEMELKENRIRLEQEKEFLNSIFGSIQDGLLVLDLSLNVMRCNPTIERWYPELLPILGKNCREVFHCPPAGDCGCPIQRTVETRASAYEVVVKRDRSCAEVGWLDIFSFPLMDKDTNEMTGVIAYVRDITERRRREIEAEAMMAVSEAIRTTMSRENLLRKIGEQICEIFGTDTMSVLTWDPAKRKGVIEYARGQWTGWLGNQILQDFVSPSGSSKNEDTSSVMLDVPALNPPDHFLFSSGIQAVASAPMVTDNNLIGAVWAGRGEPFSEQEVRLLVAIADMTANAIYRANLYEQTVQNAIDLAYSYDATIEGWAKALELRDHETEGHTRRVAEITMNLATRMGVLADERVHLWRGALLHDIGKIGIPDNILFKPGPLTDDEWRQMRNHPSFAYNMLDKIPYLQPALAIPYCHHEHWDGSGYPRGLKGEEIPLSARIFTVVDVWDALCSDRPYRTAWLPEQVREYILSMSGIQFDPAVVFAFEEFIKEELSDRF